MSRHNPSFIELQQSKAATKLYKETLEEAVITIAKITAERDRYRGALERIRDIKWSWTEPVTLGMAQDMAKQALRGDGDD